MNKCRNRRGQKVGIYELRLSKECKVLKKDLLKHDI